MIGALCYLQYHSVRNRLITRIKRLKQPKYLVGAIVGGLYLYFYFFRYLFRGVRNGQHSSANLMFSPEHAMLFESLGALVLLVIILYAWIVPQERAALTFSEAEVTFLFPAPVPRRTLIHFKLFRSQFRIVFSALILTLFTSGYGGSFPARALEWWLVLSTLNLHFLGASFGRTLLLDHGVSTGLRRILVLGLVGVAAVAVWIWAKNTLPPLTDQDTADLKSFLNYAQHFLAAGPALYLLYPFRLMLRPLFAPNLSGYLIALGPALLLMALHYFWVVRSDVAFEEASLEASQKHASRVAAVRAGNWQGAAKKQKARRAWFTLAPTGQPVMALFWKNLIGMSQVFSTRLMIVIAVVCVAFFAGFGKTPQAKHLSMVMAFIITFALAYSLLLGPQLLRLDFRRDLPMADILKTFPLRGWQIALGELLAPVGVLAGFQWLLIFVGTGLVFFLPGGKTALWLSIAASLIFVLPVLDLLLLFIPNAAVLLFPSWIQTGKDSPRGIEATGQRLIFAVGQLLVMLLALVPVTVVFLVVYFPLKLLIGPVVPLFFASLAATIALAVEAGVGVLLLGRWFEKFDVTEESGN